VANKMAEKKKNASRSRTAELKTRGREKEQPARSIKTTTREEHRETAKPESKSSVRREGKGSALATRIRNHRIGRFVFEAYYELRHKVTWPTFEQARNMTIAVIIISGVVGAILALADYGLSYLYQLIVGG